jgi:hypothetical protein
MRGEETTLGGGKRLFKLYNSLEDRETLVEENLEIQVSKL